MASVVDKMGLVSEPRANFAVMRDNHFSGRIA
jgi:hypothetical protein